MRATLLDGFEAMKKAHAEAAIPSSGTDARTKANTLLMAFREMVDEVIDNYNAARIDSESEECAANELMSDLKVYKKNIESRGPYQLLDFALAKRDASSESTRSSVSSISEKGSEKSGSGSTRSSRSIQAMLERDQELAKERARREKEKAESDVQVAELQRQIAEVQKREKLDAKLSEMREKALNKLHDDQQKLIELEEGEGEEEEERKKLEAAVGGVPLAEASQEKRTEAWATNPGRDTPPKELLARREVVKKGIEKPVYGERKGCMEEKVRVRQELETLEKEVEEKRKQMRERLAQEDEKRVKRQVEPEVEPKRGASSTMGNLLDIQARMWAASHLQGIRPKTKFSGGRKTDFAKQMKKLETALETPSVTHRQKLQELQHYFEGAAYDLVEVDVLREDAETALEEALAKLKDKFGVVTETALEMLEDLLAGKAIGEKDHAALLDFYAKLTGVYSLAKETGRAYDFEARSVIETILRKKLPHLMDQWYKKVVKYRRAKKRVLKFANFLEYLDDEHAVMEMLARANQGAQGAPKQTQVAKVSATAAEKVVTKSVDKANCAMCGADHALAECQTFCNTTAAEKRRVCIGQGICYKCLLPGHGARSCLSVKNCASCGGNHHAFVHSLFAPSPGVGVPAAEIVTAETEGGTA